jgi:hypothetical protein
MTAVIDLGTSVSPEAFAAAARDVRWEHTWEEPGPQPHLDVLPLTHFALEPTRSVDSVLPTHI